MPIIQIFGSNKCQDTRAAQRYFKERRIKVQYVDLWEKGLSRGEFDSVKRSVGVENLLDKEGREYERAGLKYMRYDIEQVMLDNPRLFRTPIVRMGPSATVGYRPEIWGTWVQTK